MQVFLIIVNLLIVLVLVCTILIQSSDSNAFGASSNFMSARSSTNPLAHFTAILAFLFFTTCMALGIISKNSAVKRKAEFRQAIADSAKQDADSAGSINSSLQSDKKSSHPSAAAKQDANNANSMNSSLQSDKKSSHPSAATKKGANNTGSINSSLQPQKKFSSAVK